MDNKIAIGILTDVPKELSKDSTACVSIAFNNSVATYTKSLKVHDKVKLELVILYDALNNLKINNVDIIVFTATKGVESVQTSSNIGRLHKKIVNELTKLCDDRNYNVEIFYDPDSIVIQPCIKPIEKVRANRKYKTLCKDAIIRGLINE